MFNRSVNLPIIDSFFIFGARGTGKSTLLGQAFSPGTYVLIDLLLPETEESYSLDPSRLRSFVLALAPEIQIIIIDEIQKVPALLDVIQHLIERDKVPHRFVMTGSSARKLKSGGANLLAGRAVTRHLFPLLEEELNGNCPINDILRWGTLPKVVNSAPESRDDFLRSYATNYLREEIQQEQFVRKLNPFRKFLVVAAQSNGRILNFSSIAKDVGVDTKTVQSYFQILEDTLVGFYLEAWHSSARKRFRKAPKFYFFDPGVARALAQQLRVIPIESTSYYGELFEHHIIREIVHLNQTLLLDLELGYLQTERNVEVDLVVRRPSGEITLVEIKSTDRVTRDSARHLLQLADDFPEAELLVLSRDSVPQKWDRVKALPWHHGIRAICRP